jgi:CheY-like chemotaxis protein
MSLSEPIPSAPLRVLVVDDLVDAADSLRLLLELWGHEVRVEYDGRRALDAARDFRPQIVLVDVQMPRMHGGEVARQIKTDPELEHAWVIATSANDRHDRRLESYAPYFHDHLVKPYNLDHLERLLATFAAQSAE